MNLWKCHFLLEINILFWVGTYVLDDSRIRYIHVRCLDMSPFTDFEQPHITKIEKIVESLPTERIDAF